MRIMVLISVLAASFLACAPVSEPDTTERAAAVSVDVASRADSVELAPDVGQVGFANAECQATNNCDNGGTDCEWIEDIDCGGTFCRVPGVQCDGQPSTFQRVEHWYLCARSTGGECYKSIVGRYLVACGC